MNGRETGGALDRRPLADVWRNTLSQIPTVFGRLVYLASLRNVNSGRYEHHGLALVFGPEDASRALKQSHGKVFAEWLSFNLEEQMADLELYLADIPEQRRTVLQAWSKLEPYKSYVPDSAKPVQRRLYLSDLRAMLELLRRAAGVDEPDQDSSPLP